MYMGRVIRERERDLDAAWLEEERKRTTTEGKTIDGGVVGEEDIAVATITFEDKWRRRCRRRSYCVGCVAGGRATIAATSTFKEKQRRLYLGLDLYPY